MRVPEFMHGRFRLPALLLIALGGLVAPGIAHAAAPTPLPYVDTGAPDPGASAAPAAERAGRALRRTLGRQGVVDVDPRTDTPRVVARLDGFLTKPDGADPEAIVLDYVRDHPETFRLDADDMARLKLVRRYETEKGVVHLMWAQTYGGIPAVGSQLIANVTADGRIINVLGSPRPDIALPTTAPDLDASEALAKARTDARAPLLAPRAQGGTGPQRSTRFAGGDRAKLVVYVAENAERLAWQVQLTSGTGDLVDTTLDADTGRVLRRVNLTDHVVNASVFDRYPGASAGGTQHTVNIQPWLTAGAGATTLDGPNAHAYADLNDSDTAQGSEETNPQSGPFTYSAMNLGGQNCPAAPFFCSWNRASGGSWGTNRNEVAEQVFYYVNHYHDHLRDDAEIGFSAAKGAFESLDPLQAEVDDGANGPGGLPNGDHLDNANMNTPPDGQSPRMQMYLFAGSSIPSVNGGDEASIVYHEYTHGLSSRLITDGSGVGALNTAQAGAMGEAWSDWYALDLLASEGFVTDNVGTANEVKIGEYVDGGSDLVRFQGLDCAVSSSCPGTSTAPSGGFTYADFGKVFSGPEVHADGEIWAETLWDIRQALGSALAERLITRALELSPPEPSFLDMRNAILQADTTFNGGAAQASLWSVFANRGMGFFASTTEASDVAPLADTHTPPTAGQGAGTVKGTVNSVTGPVAGARVGFGGHNSGFAGDLVATTAADGSYTIGNVPVGTYPQIIIDPIRGHDRLVAGPVTVTNGATITQNLTMVRDWAASAGGAGVVDFTGGNFTSQGCGPPSAIDQSSGTVWSANITNPKAYITVALPEAIDVTGFGINPTAGCGDDQQSSLGQFQVEVSSTSPTSGFTTVSSGTMTGANLNRTNPVAVPGTFVGNVRYVRLTALAPMDPNSGSGIAFVDTTEFEVFGAPAGTLLPGATAGDATGIGTTTATLNGLVDPRGLSTNFHFDYGKTTGYGTATLNGPAGAAIGNQAIASSVANLIPDTVYHYRLSATNDAGSATTVDRTFRTAAVPDTRKPKAKISMRKSQRIGAITVTVTSDEAGSVLGTATAGSTSLRPRAAKTVTLGRKTARITKPGKVKVKIKLTKSATKRLKRARKRSIKVTVRITVTDRAGNATALRKSITLKR